jgi:hypothetical protein
MRSGIAGGRRERSRSGSTLRRIASGVPRWVCLLATGCATPTGGTSAAAQLRPVAATPPPIASDASEFVCAPPTTVAVLPSIQFVARPHSTPDGKVNGPYVGMLWDVARPQGLPAVSQDARWLAYWVGEENRASLAPHYGREVVVRDLGGVERDRTFRLLENGELLRSLPDGESPSERSVRLSQQRLFGLEARVQQRVAVVNEWLGARSWSKMSVCAAEDPARIMRVGDLRVSLTPAAASARTSLEIHDAKGQLLSRSEEEFAACNGELRLVSVAVATAPSVVVVEVATIPDDSCFVPNQVRAYRIGASQVPHEPAPGAVPTVCAPGEHPTEADRWALEPYQRSDLAVSRVAPADTLNLRASPGARARVVHPLPFLLEGLRHTGRACRADGGLWLEVEHGARRGWLNQRYVSPAAAFRAVEAIGETPAVDFSAPTLAELARRLRHAIASKQSALAGAALDVEVVGHHERQGIGQIVLFTKPMGDDSISGIEYVAYAVFDDGLWRLSQLEQRETCRRGSSDGYCV